MRKLHISPDLALPPEAVTSTFVVYGGKGMGKTNFGSVFAEELSHSRLRYAVIDPMGVWWGLRHSADGKSPGIELLILGGVKGDMPIEPSGGAVVADLVVDESVNVLIDISRHANGKMWSIGERIRFVHDYFVQLYARQGEEKRPLMQVVDEAARFAPQTVRSGDVDVAKCLGAVAVMVEEGRNVGVGVCLLTQRSARLNKDVAELADCMIAFRIVGPRSIAAVMDWFGEHIPKEQWKDLIAILRKLPIGRALVVSPGWLEFEGEAQIRPRETFDSSATPKPGQKAKTPRGAAAKPDLGKYQERMAATIERAEANDPSKLKKKISELRAELAKAQKTKPAAKVDPKSVVRTTELVKAQRTLEAAMKFIIEITTKNFDAGVPTDEIHKAINGAVETGLKRVESIITSRFSQIQKLKTDAERVLQQMKQIVKSDVPVKVEVRRNEPFTVGATTSKPIRPRQHEEQIVDGELKISQTQQRILDALAWFESIGNNQPSVLQIGAVALIDATGGHFSNTVGPLSSHGLITRGNGVIVLTEKGRQFAQVPESVATLNDYHDVLRQRVRKLKSASGKTIEILNVIINRGGADVTTEEIGREVGIDHTGGHFSNSIGPLGGIGLIRRNHGVVTPTEILFPPGLA